MARSIEPEAAGASDHFAIVVSRYNESITSKLLSGAVETAQLPLLPESTSGAETERDRTLSRAVDTVRARFGREAIVAASLADRGRRRRR